MLERNHLGSRFSFVVLEALLVVFGVFAAMAVNEWRATLDNREHAAAARRGIIDEIKANQARIAAAQAYHHQLLESLSAFERTQPAGSYPDLRTFSRGFIMPNEMAATAWDAARVTGALRYMDYDEVLLFSDVYLEQITFERLYQTMTDILFTTIYQDGKEAILRNYRHLAEVVASLQWKERKMLGIYEQALRALAEAEAPPAPASPDQG